MARSPAHSSLTDGNGTLISLKRCVFLAIIGSFGSLSGSVAMDAIIVSLAVCAVIASPGLLCG